LETTPEEVKQALESGTIRLIDVRGSDEWEIAHIDGATLVTQELSDEMQSSWDKDTAIVFYCHSGVRSMNAVHFFQKQGFTNVKSMTGGIEAWSISIDTSVPRY
jgi:rhodanese-related sulfurtransferase